MMGINEKDDFYQFFGLENNPFDDILKRIMPQ
jgi:hypothetical protein